MVLKYKALNPEAILLYPVVLLRSALFPLAVFLYPVVLAYKA